MQAYCLFCETQRCKFIAEFIRKNYGYICISPQIIQRKWIRGISLEEKHDWLPGYLFVYSEDPITPRFEVGGIIRCLSNEALSGRDDVFAQMILERDGVVGNVSLIREGDLCRISDPAWEKLQGRVIKLDRGRQRCCISYFFDGCQRSVWAGYDMISQKTEKT